MNYYPLTLGVVRPNWAAGRTVFTASTDVEQARNAILTRDDHTCQCCGFRAERHQEILHLDGNAKNFSDDNVITTCIFCHQCFDLEGASRMRSGMLIWLPEILQADLHHLMRSVYLARTAQGGMAETGRKVFDVLYKRGEEARKRLGATDPEALAIVLRDFLTRKEYERAQERMEGIRLLPLDQRSMPNTDGGDGSYNHFATVLGYWRQRGPYSAMPAQNWPSLFKDL